MAALPEEVLKLLSMHGPLPMRFEDGKQTTVNVAPLDKQLYLLVRRGHACLDALLQNNYVDIVAENKEKDYFIRLRGRAVPGRTVPGDPRRSELVHWLPEGLTAPQTDTILFHPEQMEYSKGQGAGRWKAQGAIPGTDLPAPAERWIKMGTHGTIPWFVAMCIIDWVGLLFFAPERSRNELILLFMILAGTTMLSGAAIWNQYWAYVRWREAKEKDAASRLVQGWMSPMAVPKVGIGLLVGGLLFSLLLGLGGGTEVVLITLIGSGVWWYLPFHGVRYLFRKSAEDKGELS